jgi:transposase
VHFTPYFLSETGTAPVIAKYIEEAFKVKYSFSSIYDVLERLNLSHERAHQHYWNDDKKRARKFYRRHKKKKTALKKKK